MFRFLQWVGEKVEELLGAEIEASRRELAVVASVITSLTQHARMGLTPSGFKDLKSRLPCRDIHWPVNRVAQLTPQIEGVTVLCVKRSLTWLRHRDFALSQ